MKGTKLALAAATAVTTAAAVGPAHAVTVNDLGVSLSQIRSLNAQLTAPIVSPGIAFGSPIGFGANLGQAFIGAGGQSLPPGGQDDVDGSAFAGFGLGNSVDAIGLEIAATAISVQEDFGEDGNLNGKVHRVIGERGGLGVGVENASGWGAAEDADESYYGVYTQSLELSPDTPRYPVTLSVSVGIGNERFVDPGEDGVGLFGAIAIAPIRQVSLIVDYTGRDTNAAVSMVPFYRTPLVITLGAINLGERLGNDTEFAAGLGYLFQF